MKAGHRRLRNAPLLPRGVAEPGDWPRLVPRDAGEHSGSRWARGAVRLAIARTGGKMSRGIFQDFGFHRIAVGRQGALALLLGILLLLAAGPAKAQCVGTDVCTVATASDLVSALTTDR